MDSIELLKIAVITFYGAGTVLFFCSALLRKEVLKKGAAWCAFIGFGMHTCVLVADALGHTWLTLPRGYYVKLLSWSLLGIFFLIWWRLKLEFLSLIASPLALLLFIFSMTLSARTAVMPKALSGLFFGLHIGTLYLSLGLLVMAFGAGVLFLYLERKIKAKERLTGFSKDMPALAAFDRANHVAVLIGFPAFTLGILSGFVWARGEWGKVVTWDPKEIISVVIWLLFALLFYQRTIMGWRGRKPARLAILLFVFAVLSLMGVNLFLPSHHSFQQ